MAAAEQARLTVNTYNTLPMPSKKIRARAMQPCPLPPQYEQHDAVGAMRALLASGALTHWTVGTKQGKICSHEQFRSVIRYTFWMRIHRTTRLPCILMRCSRLSPIITDSSFLIGECRSCVVYSCHMRSPVLDFVRSPRTRLRALAAEFLGWLPHSRPCEVWHAAWTIAGAACHRPQPEVR